VRCIFPLFGIHAHSPPGRYVFHEVRVPLNTALLAAQNVRASLGAHARAYQIEFSALDGSLNQMSAVLNDILDFNRMDSGKFAFVARVSVRQSHGRVVVADVQA
jgi:signal transduction histidine kinase